MRSLHDFFNKGVKFIDGDNNIDDLGKSLRLFEEMCHEKHKNQCLFLENQLKNITINEIL